MIELMTARQNRIIRTPLIYRIVPSPVATTLQISCANMKGTITFDKPGSQQVLTTNATTVTIQIPPLAEYIYINLGLNQVIVNRASNIITLSNNRIVETVSWGTLDPRIHIRTNYCSELVKVPNFKPPYNDITSLFSNSAKFNQDVSHWDMTGVTDIGGIFDECPSFNKTIVGWNVESVTRMNFLFSNAKSFNQDLSSMTFANVPPDARIQYDGGTPAWLPAYKPKFLLK